MARQLIVIGGTAAGLSAASKAKRSDPTLQVKVFEKSGYVSYGACGLPYYIGDTIKQEQELISLTVSVLKNKRGIEAFLHHEVILIDRQNKCVTVRNLEQGTLEQHKYDALVIATGAVPIVPSIQGVNCKNIYTLRTMEDGIAIKNSLTDSVKAVSIIGAGFIGLELAEQFTLRGLQVSLFEAMPRLLPFLPEDYSAKVKEELERHGVRLHLGSRVVKIQSDNQQATHIQCADDTVTPTDLIILSVGVTPNAFLAAESGLEIGQKGCIMVNASLQTSDAAIWACGDCVQMCNLITGAPAYIPLGTTANKQGKVAGSNIAGKACCFPGVLGTQVTKVFDLYLASTGLTLSEAKASGFDVATSCIVKKDKASYYPGGQENHLCFIFDRNGGRLLGAQAVGSESVAGRINVLATAITAKMTVSQIAELDLAYSPSVAPVYDPILIAAMQANKDVSPLK